MSRVLTYDEVQRYLERVRKGEGLNRAARLIGVEPKQIREARKINPEFDDDVKLAEAEATDPVEKSLYGAAVNGEPWAVKLWLERRSSDRWAAVPTTIKVEHGLAPGAERILELAQRLALRREMLGLTSGEGVLDCEAEPE